MGGGNGGMESSKSSAVLSGIGGVTSLGREISFVSKKELWILGGGVGDCR